MNLPSRWRRLAILAILPTLAVIFWLTALLASNLPEMLVVGVNVHGLTLTSYAGDPGQRPAPLSLSVLDDVRQDAGGGASATGAAGQSLTMTPSPGLSPLPSPGASAPSGPTPTPTPNPLPSPLPTSLPLPTPTPTATPKASISGQVMDTVTHFPIVGATVSLSPSGQSTTTDVNGDYSLAVNPGTYTVTASAVGYNGASQTVTVNGGQNQIVTFKLVSLTATGSIKGTVTNSATAAAIPGATVTLSNGLTTVTDVNGNYSFAAVLYGSYTIKASAIGFLSEVQPVTVKPGHQTTLNFQLTR